MIILSWKFNNDYCLLTQFEEKIFGQTCMFTKKAKKIPYWIKYITYISFSINIIYKFYINYL